jgi:nitrogen regulatory protein P-II 1
MKKIEAIIQPYKLEEVKDALTKIDICGITISQVMGCGRQKGFKEVYRATEIEINILPKIKLEIVVPDETSEQVIEVVIATAHSGEIGDGKIFVSTIEDAIRIRTGERGLKAL